MAKRRKVGFFEKVTYTIKGAEASIVELLVTVGPWLAPLTPASMTFDHVVNTLGFDQIWGWTTALSVEILGLASGHTWAKFSMHNKKYTAKKDKLPVWPIVLTFGFYLIVVGTVNLAIDWTMTDWPMRVARLCLILLTVPAIVIVSIRAQHAKILMEKDPLFVEETVEVAPPQPKAPPKKTNGYSDAGINEVRKWLHENQMTAHDVGRDGLIAPKDLAEEINANPVTVRTSLSRLRSENE